MCACGGNSDSISKELRIKNKRGFSKPFFFFPFTCARPGSEKNKKSGIEVSAVIKRERKGTQPWWKEEEGDSCCCFCHATIPTSSSLEVNICTQTTGSPRTKLAKMAELK